MFDANDLQQYGHRPRRSLRAFRTLSEEPDDFELPPFSQWGGLGKAYKLFGADMQPILDQLNEALAA